MKIIITGGAGFIGSNTAAWYAKRGHRVVIADNLSRRGTKENMAWLRKTVPSGSIALSRVDVRRPAAIDRVFSKNRDADFVLHLAAQVAVTTSVVNPRHDFSVNAFGTFNVLEAVRKHCPQTPFVYASTNKVYGGMTEVRVKKNRDRYVYQDYPKGVDESFPLNFHSPYGCSKGSADQYVRDYARIYGMKTIVFRQSCIYGERQFGVEDQGWVAWFIIARTLGRPITIYGDGMQVRDVLHVQDLIRAYDAARRCASKYRGEVYNIGGGASNAIPVAWVLQDLNRSLGEEYPLSYEDWRPGDQPIFVCNVGKANRELGWKPKITAPQGIRKLYKWVQENRSLFSKGRL